MGDTDATNNNPVQRPPFPIEWESVARALSLLQPPESTAVDLESRESLGADDFPKLLQHVQRRHQVQSLLSRLPFSGTTSERMLGPELGARSFGAVLLPFHVGLDIPVTTLAAALGITEDEAGDEMYRARLALTGHSGEACQQMRGLAGRYADSGLTRDQMATLINHANACEQCRQVLDEFHAVDERIRTAIETAPLPNVSDNPPQVNRNTLLLWAPILLVIVLAATAVFALGFNAATQSGPVPLFAAAEQDEHSGWLIMSTETEVMAVDLEHGERRRILENPAHDWWNPWIVSPDGQLIVRWEERTRINTMTGALRAYDTNGQRRYLHRWDAPRSRIFSGWLGNRTVLFLERGPVHRSGVSSEAPLSAQPGLIAADLETGHERQIYQGPVDKVIAAPDGEHIAIVRPASPDWPGKTVEIRPVEADGLGDPVNTIEDRYLSWSGRMLWSDDGQSLYLSLLSEEELDDLGTDDDVTPSQYGFEQLSLARVGIDGSLTQFGDTTEPGWTVVQAISPDESAAAVLLNSSGDRDSEWNYGTIDLLSGDVTMSQETISGNRWWNSEMLWLPDNATSVTQQISAHLPSESDGDTENESVVLNTMNAGSEPAPLMVFHDAAPLNLRPGHGLALLRWVPDDVLRAGDSPDTEPRPGLSRAVQHVNSSHQLYSGSSVAPTGRHILLERTDTENARVRMVHMQAWAGTESDYDGSSEFSWLPREPAMIGVAAPDEENLGSRLVIVSSDRASPLHNRTLDPAGIGGRSEFRYRTPVVSPDGTRIAFIVTDARREEMSLWISGWDGTTGQVADWSNPSDATIQQTPIVSWLDNDSLLYTEVTGWDDDYPQRVTLFRGDIRDDGSLESTELRSFSVGARDRGIDLAEVSVGPEHQRVAFRTRHYTGSDPDDETRDTVQISPADDLGQSIEITRSDLGEGLTWLNGDDWLIAGIDGRIALMDATGRTLDYLTDSPSAYPVLIGGGDLWYQDLENQGRIMRVSFNE